MENRGKLKMTLEDILKFDYFVWVDGGGEKWRFYLLNGYKMMAFKEETLKNCGHF